MTTYTAVTTGQRDAESPIDTTVIGQMIDNPIAITEGSTGAPNIVQAAMGASSIGQGEMKTTTSDQSLGTINQSTTSQIALTGGAWTINYCIGGASTDLQQSPGQGTYGWQIGIGNYESGYNYAGYVRSRYIQASPPYNLGDGDIPLFVFALVENGTGLIKETSVAIDPPWAYHGPHNITPDRIDIVTGRKYKKVPEFILNNVDIKAELMSNNAGRREAALNMLRNKKLVEIELDDAYKNQDSAIIPHPFVNDLTNCTVVMIDPVSPLCLDLYELHKQVGIGDDTMESVSNLIHDDYIKLNNAELPRATPGGVIAVQANWKNTP